MRNLLGVLLLASLAGNIALGTVVFKQDDLIDRQMNLIKSAQARAESRNSAGGGIPTRDLTTEQTGCISKDSFPQKYADAAMGIERPCVFDYEYWTDSAAKPAWMPKSIKSDGQKTYIQFPDADLLAPPKPGEVSRAPSLVVMKTAQGETSTYRYSVVGDRYEVIGVIEKAVLIGPSGDENDRVLILHGPAPTNDSK